MHIYFEQQMASDMNHSKKTNPLKKWTIIIIIDFILILCVVLGIIIFFPFSKPPIKIEGVYVDKPREIANFNFTNQYGHAFTQDNLLGHWTLMFFGFTRCPTVCPSLFDALNKMYGLLEKQLPSSLLPQVVFITIDPENDTKARLYQYVNSYNTHFIGARADINETKALERELSIAVTNFNGTINHNTDILVINPKGQIQAYFLYPHRPQNMARDYQLIVKKYLSFR